MEKNIDLPIGGILNDPEMLAKHTFKTYREFSDDKNSPNVYSFIYIDGKEFKGSCNIEIIQHTNKHDTFTIFTRDDNFDSFHGYVMENSKNLSGKNISIEFKKFGELRQTFTGIIGKVENTKNEGGGYGKLIITGFAPSILLESGKDCQSFENKTLEQIIKQIVSEYPQEAKIETKNLNTKRSLPYTVQYKETDYEFIQRLAILHGEYFYYNGQELIFGNKVQPIIQLEEGSDLIDVQFELSTKPQDFSYIATDISSGEVISRYSSQVQKQYKENPFQAIQITSSNRLFKKKPQMHFNQTGSESELNEAVRKEKEKRENLVLVKGKSKNPELKIGGRAKLIDINDKPMETYRIIEIKHYFDGTKYYNEFVAIPDLFTAPYQDNEAVPVGEIQSARVLENNDPSGIGRVRVQFPWQMAKGEKTPWIHLIQPHSGSGKGFYFIPEIGEEVLVGYESGNAEKPFVMGTKYNEKERSGYHTAGNNIKAIKTRSGIENISNDAEGSWKQSTPDGNFLHFDGQGNAVLNVPKNLIIKVGGNMAVNVSQNMSQVVGINVFHSAGMNITMNTPEMKQYIANYFHTEAGKALINSENEIKIEAKETSVSGYKKLFVHSNESATINSKGLVEIKGESGTNQTNIADEQAPVSLTDIGECIVEFRPRIANYGKFGFDFMRIGDNAGNGVQDETYLGNMGSYLQNDYNNTFTPDASPYHKFKSLITNEYNPINISVAEFKKTNIRERYAVPWLSLYRIPAGKLLIDGTPDPEADTCIAATLKLLIEVKTEPDELRLEFDDRYFTITGGGGIVTKAEASKPNLSYFEIPNKSVTAGAAHTMDIEINCIKEFPNIMSIKAFAVTKVTVTDTTVESLAGKLMIKPNNKANRKIQKIVLVNVQTSSAPTGGVLTGQRDLLKHTLRQALIDPKIKETTLALRNENAFNAYNQGTSIKGFYEYDYSNARVNTHQPRVWKELDQYLNDKLRSQEGSKYDTYIKVFYFGSIGGYIKADGTFNQLNGYSTTGKKTTILFDGYDVTATTPHEVLHSMGLDHTFESKNIIPTGMSKTNAPNGKYTFKKGTTDNIMDYASVRKSLMEWQWDILKANAQPEP